MKDIFFSTEKIYTSVYINENNEVEVEIIKK